MRYYSERNNLRVPIDFTEKITGETYNKIFELCSKYFNNLAWRFPLYMPESNFCYGIDWGRFSEFMNLEIPGLYKNKDGFPALVDVNSDFDQYALLDLIEFILDNCRDIDYKGCDMFNCSQYKLLESEKVKSDFKYEINNILYRLGVLYQINESNLIERTTINTPLSQEIEMHINNIGEQATKDLLLEAIRLFKKPHPYERRSAVEKIWDALERLKTYYSNLDKKKSVNKIVEDMSEGQTEFKDLFESEFKALTTIGNNFRIRHHETNKVNITDDKYYDYFFNRCLSLIALAIQYLK